MTFQPRSFISHDASRRAVLVLLAVACLSARTVPAAEGDAKDPPREIRQGGYVEKVDPSVDYTDRLPRIPPKEPAESLKTFHIVPGLRIEQVAAEPLVRDAVDLAFDENGRLFVAEMIPYAEGGTSKFGSPGGRVSMLEDTDGDGRFDRSTVYADKLVWPTGVACFDGGIFVAAAPDIWYFKDTDGDGKADVREVWITGFELSNPNALPNSLRWRLDGRIHGMTSTTGGLLRAVQWETGGGKVSRPEVEDRKAAPVQSRGRDFSFDPRTGELRLESGGSQFGMTFDAWGRKFECSNSAPIEMVMYEDRYIARNPMLVAPSPLLRVWVDGNAIYRTSPLEPWRVVRTEMRIGGSFSGPVEGGGKAAGYFTAACGVFVYTGDAWPAEYLGNAFVCEGAGNLVHRMRIQPAGVAVSAHRTEQKSEFLTSDEIWFRPIQFTDAPDGNLYLADMYRELFEHPDAVPPSVKKHLDLTAGNDRGRIYRIVPEGFVQPKPVRLADLSTAELVGLLEHANGWHRHTAARLLYQRRARRAIEPLSKLAGQSTSPLGRMHAMHALAAQDALSPEIVLARLDDEHPRVREHAVRLAERVLADSVPVREKLCTMAGDADVRVRYQAAFTLGEIPGDLATDALAAIAAADAGDRWIRLAVLSSSLNRAGELLARLASDAKCNNRPDGLALIEEMAEQTGLQDRADQVAEALRLIDSLGADRKQLVQAVVRGLGRGLDKAGSPLRQRLISGGKASVVLAAMVRESVELAGDVRQPVDRRVGAVRSLALASFDEARRVLGDLLDGRQPQEVQIAAVRALSRFRRPEVAEMIVDGWLGFSPKVRGEAAEALFARAPRLSVLLTALDQQRIRPSQLDPARIRFLLDHPDEKIRERSKRLLGSAKLAPRAVIVKQWQDVLKMKGDATRGKTVFKRECAKCHRLEGVGVELGLPLNTIGNRGAETILLSVLDPNREVNPAYLNYVIVTDAGRSLTGMITAETATSITLKRAEGQADTVLRTNIDEMQSTGLSIMPEGQEKLITRQEMADVIGYLMSLE
ncbi:MAG: c-type cytochrome [Candidatus Nealsonbacteria bacterium]|nr:c-type cytochrome [Candidatus Nealsonbacteria bacterium]